MLERSQHPQTPKLCGKLSIGNVFLCRKNMIFFTKNIFSQYFPDFLVPQDSEFQDLADPGCVRPYYRLPTWVEPLLDLGDARGGFDGSLEEVP